MDLAINFGKGSMSGKTTNADPTYGILSSKYESAYFLFDPVESGALRGLLYNVLHDRRGEESKKAYALVTVS